MKYCFILISLLTFYSCKIPINSINDKSFPSGSKFINYTDTLFYKVYKLNQIELTQFIVELNEKNYDLLIMNDSLRVIGLNQKLKDTNYTLRLYFEKGIITPSSTVDTLKKINDLGLDFINPKPLSFHKKGISYNAVLDSLHKWTFSYLSDNYTKFFNDTLKTYFPDQYSIQFSTHTFNGGLSSDLVFLPLSIAYFEVYSHMMDNWDPRRRKNMQFLIQHQFDDVDMIDQNFEKYLDENDLISASLCRLLKYIKQPSAEDYKLSQLIFREDLEYRWIDDLYIKEKKKR